MKILRIDNLISRGPFVESDHFRKVIQDITEAINLIVWPVGSNKFSIFPERKGNGVSPIKLNCISHLKERGWTPEERLVLSSSLRPGPIDAVLTIPQIGKVAFEWETGNVSSSHRALNKMLLGMMNKTLLAGILAIPSRNLYPFLTDRIGSYSELEPYLPVWKNSPAEGALIIIEFEHDELNENVPKIPKGTDGRALV